MYIEVSWKTLLWTVFLMPIFWSNTPWLWKRPYVTTWELQVWFWLFLESDTMKKCPDKDSRNVPGLQSDTISPLHYYRVTVWIFSNRKLIINLRFQLPSCLRLSKICPITIQITFQYCFTFSSLHFCFQRVIFQKLAQNYIFQLSCCSFSSGRARNT